MLEFLPFEKAIVKHGRQSGIYRIYAPDDGKVLYVGQAQDFRRRMVQHRNKKPWFKNVAINFEPCPVDELNARESDAIRSAARTFKLHNISQNTNEPGLKQKVISGVINDPTAFLRIAVLTVDTLNELKGINMNESTQEENQQNYNYFSAPFNENDKNNIPKFMFAGITFACAAVGVAGLGPALVAGAAIATVAATASTVVTGW